MTPDWDSATLLHSMRVELVDPLNLETLRSGLSGLNPSGKLSLNYYGDTRAGLTISTSVPIGESDGWDGTAAMRLVHSVAGWEETLFTGYVTDAPWKDANGTRVTDYTLSSALYGLQADKVSWPYTVGANAMGLDAIEAIFEQCRNRPHRVLAGAKNYRFGSATVYEAGKTWLSVLLDIADRSGDRIDVDGRGYVTVAPYSPPSERTPVFVLDADDPMTTALDGISGSNDALSIPSRAVVHAKSGDMELTGRASQPSSSPYSHARRGYNLDLYADQSDMEPFTQAQADFLAAQSLAQASALTESRDASMLYRPLSSGDVIAFRRSREESRYMVSTAELDLSTWIWSLGLKGVA